MPIPWSGLTLWRFLLGSLPYLIILPLPRTCNEAPLGQGWCGPVQALWSVHALSSDFKGGDIVFTRTFFIVLTYVLADSSSL